MSTEISSSPIFLAPAAMPAVVGMSLSTIRRLTAQGLFPQPRALGLRRVGYLRSEIEAWAASRPVSDVLPVGLKAA